MNDFKYIFKSILYTLLFIFTLSLLLKVGFWLLKVIFIIVLIALGFGAIKYVIKSIEEWNKKRKRQKKGYEVDEDGIVDVDYEDEDED